MSRDGADLGGSMEMSEWWLVYEGLSTALRKSDLAAAEALTDSEVFVANLPGVKGLDWRQFCLEYARRSAPFADFGEHVEILNTGYDDSVMFVHYRMTVTHTAPLTAWGTSETVPATGKTISYDSVDIVTFDTAGKIIRVEVIADRLQNIIHMAGG